MRARSRSLHSGTAQQWMLGACLMAGLFGASAWAQSTASIARVEFTSDAGTDQIYPQGSVVALRVTFTEPVWVSNSPGIRLVLGTTASSTAVIAPFQSGSGGRRLNFGYRVRAGDSDADGISIPSNAISLGARGRIVDSAGLNARLAHAAVRPQRAHRVDGVAPRVTAIDVASPAGNHGAGEHIDFDLTFSKDAVAGAAELLVTLAEPGTTAQTRRAQLIDPGPGRSLRFRYTVQAGDQDGDGISVEANALTGGTVADTIGNRAVRTLPRRTWPTHTVGVAAAVVEEVEVTSRPRSEGTYRPGETIQVGVTFNAPVYVGGDVRLDLSIGARTRAAELADGSGTRTLVFRYTVRSDDRDDDGISVGPGPGSLTGGTIQDAGGKPASRVFTALPASSDHRVGADGRVAATGVRIASQPTGAYQAGDVIRLVVTFADAVYVRGLPTLAMVIGDETRRAVYASGSETAELTFHYTVQRGDLDADGIRVPPGGESLTGGVIEDRHGTAAVRDFDQLPDDPRHKVGTASGAAVEEVEVTSRPRAGGTYRTGETIQVGITFDAPVYVSGDLALDLSVGARTRAATFAAGSGSRTLVFRYRVRSGDRDDDGISIGPGPGSLRGGAIEDEDGLPANRTFARLPNLAAHKVAADDDDGDEEAPSVSGVSITSSPATPSSYSTGEAIEVTITFNEVVHVTQSPRLLLNIGTNTRAAAYRVGSGSTRLTFRYVVRSDDQDGDGISIGPGPGSLTGGTIQDANGNAARRAFTALPANRDHRVGTLDAAAVTSVRISSETADGYQAGDVIRVTVTFDAAVYVRGSPALAIMVGEETRRAAYAAGSGTTTLTFEYTVQGGDSDANGISVPRGSESLTGGVIEDQHGTAAARDFAALPDDRNHRVAAGPSATGVTITSSPASGDTYAVGEEIEVVVTFNGTVRVVDAGQLKLGIDIGGRTVNADFVGGSGTARLSFSYTVQRGDRDRDGISIAGTALSSGGVTDSAGAIVRTEFRALADQSGHKVGAGSLVTAALPGLVVGGAPTEVRLANLLSQTGLGYRGGFAAPEVTPANVVRVTLSGQSSRTVLTVFPYAEGTANVAVAARDAAITLVFSVSVGTDVAEDAMLEDVLASVGRGLLASASDVIGGRLKTDPTARLAPEAGGVAGAPTADGWAGAGGGESLRWLSGAQHMNPDPNHPQRGMAAQQLLSSLAFDMPLLEQGQRGSSVSVWGAGDVRRFDGEVEEGSFDGDLELAYLGLDARVGNWVVGSAVAHSRGDATYAAATATGVIDASLETELTAFHPYVQWRFSERTEAWAILGYGEGEVTHTRDGLGYVDEPSDLTMAMGLAGVRGTLSRGSRFGLVWHGDAGMIQLETEEGEAAISDLSLSMSRARLGIEASYRLAFGGGRYSFTPFLDLTARYDGGEGEDGAGVEVAGGLRYQGPIVSFEAKARSLVWHGADGYSESGASAAIIVEPGNDGCGLRLSLAPRWGASADPMDMFWRHSGFGGQGVWRGEQERGWGMAGRLSYGFGVNRGLGRVTPFADFDFTGSARRTRIGVGYGLSSPWGIPLRIDLSGERMEDERGADHRFLLTGEALF